MDQRLPIPCRPLGHLLWAAIFVVSAFSPAFGFDDEETHPRITTLAVDASKLDTTLKKALSIINGKDAMLQPASGPARSALDWLRTGSTREDSPACRASNHFHNPLKEYTAAGLADLPDTLRTYCASQGFSPIRSSATWGTKYTSPNQKEPSLIIRDVGK